MCQELVGHLILTSVVTVTFALGRWIYVRYYKTPVRDFSSGINDLGEDDPVIEGLLSIRENYVQQGKHSQALDYSMKALERCPTSARIKQLVGDDRANISVR